MPSEFQESFHFDDDPIAPADRLLDPLSDFIADVSKAWDIPLGERVRVRLHDTTVPELTGKLSLARAPELPLDPRQPLALSLCGVEFTHREIEQWSLL